MYSTTSDRSTNQTSISLDLRCTAPLGCRREERSFGGFFIILIIRIIHSTEKELCVRRRQALLEIYMDGWNWLSQKQTPEPSAQVTPKRKTTHHVGRSLTSNHYQDTNHGDSRSTWKEPTTMDLVLTNRDSSRATLSGATDLPFRKGSLAHRYAYMIDYWNEICCLAIRRLPSLGTGGRGGYCWVTHLQVTTTYEKASLRMRATEYTTRRRLLTDECDGHAPTASNYAIHRYNPTLAHAHNTLGAFSIRADVQQNWYCRRVVECHVTRAFRLLGWKSIVLYKRILV